VKHPARIGLSLIIVIQFIFVACTETADQRMINRINWPIINGTPDTSSAHQAVVYLQMNWSGCTGTLIANRVVLTAAHCVSGVSNSGIDVGFGDDQWSMTWRGVSNKWIHPQYDSEYTQYDIALVRLSSNAPVGVTPIPNLPERFELEPNDIGIQLEFVGFGETEYGSSGTKLKATGYLGWLCLMSSGCVAGDYVANPKTICYDQNPGGPCHGDSGGPAFVMRSGTEYVAGITSYGINDNCTLFGCSSKVDEYEQDILDFIGRVNGASCSMVSQCDSGYCVDGKCCESACTGVCNSCDVPAYPGLCRTVVNCPTLKIIIIGLMPFLIYSASKLVQTSPSGNCIQPGTKLGVGLIPFSCPVNLDENLLHRFLGNSSIVKEPIGKSGKLYKIALQKLLKSRFIARLNQQHQLMVRIIGPGCLSLTHKVKHHSTKEVAVPLVE